MKKFSLFLTAIIIMFLTQLIWAETLTNSHYTQETYLDRLKAALQEKTYPRTISQGDLLTEVEVNYINSMLWYGMKDIEINDNYAYCTFQQGLMQVDISDPTNPVMKNSVDLIEGEAWGLDFYDDYVLIANGAAGLAIGQIDDNHDLHIIENDPTLGPALDVFTQDSVVFIAEGHQGMDILSNMSQGSYLRRGHITTQNTVIKVVAQGDFAYLADGEGGLTIVNTSDIDNPAIIGNLDNIGFAADLAISGQYAYVAIENAGFAVVNIADPNHPRLIKTESSPNGANGIEISGNYAYVTHASANGLLIYDISMPENPTLIGKQNIAGSTLAVKIDNGNAYVAGWQSGLNVIDVSTNENPRQIANLESPGAIHTVQTDVLSTYAASSAWQVGRAGFHIIDWQEIGIPKMISTFRIEGSDIYDFAIQGNHAYLTDFNNGLVILDIHDHENPVRVGYYPIAGYSYNISVTGDLACVVTGQDLQIIRIADPSQPHLVYQYQPQAKITDLKLVNSLAFIGMDSIGMEILNLEIPEQPEVIGGYYGVHSIQNLDVDGNTAYLTDALRGFVAVDISDLSRPVRTIWHKLEDNSNSDLYYADNYVHITNLLNGISFFNVTDKQESYLAGIYPTRGISRDFITESNFGFIADYYGLSVILLDKPLISIDPAEFRLTAYENGASPYPQYIDISNESGGELYWQASANSSWIDMSITAGYAGSILMVSADISGLSEGLYYDTITFKSNATNTPTLIPVTLYIEPANSIPQLDELEDQFISENEILNLIVSASDEEGTIPILKAEQLPDNASFTDNQDGTGLFEFTPSFEQAGQYSIMFIATENGDPLLTSSDKITITVENVNRQPLFIPFYNDTAIVEDDTLELSVQVNDPDKELVIMKVFNLPENAQFIYTDTVGGTATLIFTPDYTQVGQVYPLEIRAVDLYDALISDTINLTVANRQLEIIDFQAAPPITGIKDILISDSIMIFMNEAVLPETLDEYFTVNSAKSDQFKYSYDSETFMIKIKPFETEFKTLDTIQITLLANLLDLAGQPLGEDISHTVYTGAVIHPGDTDNDGIVDERDILPLGIYYNQIGPIRNDIPDCSWGRFLAHQWELLGSTFADADGSGQVDAEDICAISQNWNSTHDENITAGKRLTEMKAHLKRLDENVLIDLYDNLINCEDSEGKEVLTGVLLSLMGNAQALPASYELGQNYPNPFNPITSISYALPERTFVAIQIYDILGRQVATLVNDMQEAGYYTQIWDGTNFSNQPVSSGIYLYKLQTTNSTLARKMLLLK